MASLLIVEFIALKAKMYSIKSASGSEICKAKGVKKSVVKKKISHEHYNNVIQTQNTVMATMTTLRSKHNEKSIECCGR